MLRDGERSANEFGQRFAMTQAAVSQHLHVRREAGLVSTGRDWHNGIYRIEPDAMRVIDDWLEHYRAFSTGRLWKFGEHLDETD